MCGPQIEKKKDVGDGEDDGIEAGPLILLRADIPMLPIWRDSLDTVLGDISRRWPVRLHMYREPARILM
jgi:hypothetical protein